MMLPSPLRIEPISGYSPAVGCMLTYVRATTFAAVDGMTMKELDHLHDSQSKSFGALLAHIAAEERSYQVMTFEDRSLSSDENAQSSAALKLETDALARGDAGRPGRQGRRMVGALSDISSKDQRALGLVSCRRGRDQSSWTDSLAAKASTDRDVDSRGHHG